MRRGRGKRDFSSVLLVWAYGLRATWMGGFCGWEDTGYPPNARGGGFFPLLHWDLEEKNGVSREKKAFWEICREIIYLLGGLDLVGVLDGWGWDWIRWWDLPRFHALCWIFYVCVSSGSFAFAFAYVFWILDFGCLSRARRVRWGFIYGGWERIFCFFFFHRRSLALLVSACFPSSLVFCSRSLGSSYRPRHRLEVKPTVSLILVHRLDEKGAVVFLFFFFLASSFLWPSFLFRKVCSLVTLVLTSVLWHAIQTLSSSSVPWLFSFLR